MVSADYSIYIGHYNFPLQVTMKAIAIVAILVSLMISVPACKLIPAYYFKWNAEHYEESVCMHVLSTTPIRLYCAMCVTPCMRPLQCVNSWLSFN